MNILFRNCVGAEFEDILGNPQKENPLVDHHKNSGNILSHMFRQLKGLLLFRRNTFWNEYFDRHYNNYNIIE